MQISTVQTPFTRPTVAADVLTAIATACRDRERLRFDYQDHRGAESIRVAEPHELVTWGRRWYLVAWDVERDDWRTFRVDRMRPRVPTGPRFARRALPDEDAAAFVARTVARMWPYQTTITLRVPADSPQAQACVSYGEIEPVDEHTCRFHVGADSPRGVAFLLGALEVDFDVDPSSELGGHLAGIADRFNRALGR